MKKLKKSCFHANQTSMVVTGQVVKLSVLNRICLIWYKLFNAFNSFKVRQKRQGTYNMLIYNAKKF